MGASLTPFLTDGALLGLCSASAVFSFLPVSRLGLINLEGYIAFSLFPHLSAIPPRQSHEMHSARCHLTKPAMPNALSFQPGSVALPCRLMLNEGAESLAA